MLRFRDLSFRYKIPLRGTALVIVTAMLVTGTLIAREYDELKQDLMRSSAGMGRLLANTLVTPLVHDDVWRSYEIINSPFQLSQKDETVFAADLVMVLDRSGQVYASTRPGDYPMLTDPARTDPDYLRVQQVAGEARSADPASVEIPGSDRIYTVVPVVADGVALGTLVMGYSKSRFLPRYYGIVKRAALVTLAVIALIIPVSWYWAQRMAVPLVELAGYMSRVGPELPRSQELRIYESRDELGRLGVAFRAMLEELHEKQALERQVVVADRLAALGRLSAGIAHEINNPLGGMLNAISTWKRHGPDDPVTLKTLSLVERGLVQIKETVAALLVEARVESHPLSRQDVQDTQTLVLPELHKRGIRLTWENDLSQEVRLPSTLVRQVLLNLLLNAARAASENVYCHAYLASGKLYLLVKNDGRHIREEDMPYLFEPFSRLRAGADAAAEGNHGSGLGLWVSYQIVQQLGGRIEARSQPGETRFVVSLPVGEPAA